MTCFLTSRSTIHVPASRVHGHELSRVVVCAFEKVLLPLTRAVASPDFAQLEARIILAFMFRHYTFELAEPTLTLVRQRDGIYWGENFGTMAPRGGLHCIVRPRAIDNTTTAKL